MKTADLTDLQAAVRAALDDAITARLTEHVVETAAADAALREALAPLCLASHERKILASMASGDAKPEDLVGLTRSAFVSHTRGLIFEAIRSQGLARVALTIRDLSRICGLHGGIEEEAIRFEVTALVNTPIVCGALLRAVVLEVIAADALSTFVADIRTLFRLTKAQAEGFHERQSHTGAIDAGLLRERLRGLASDLTPHLKALEEVR